MLADVIFLALLHLGLTLAEASFNTPFTLLAPLACLSTPLWTHPTQSSHQVGTDPKQASTDHTKYTASAWKGNPPKQILPQEWSQTHPPTHLQLLLPGFSASCTGTNLTYQQPYKTCSQASQQAMPGANPANGCTHSRHSQSVQPAAMGAHPSTCAPKVGMVHPQQKGTHSSSRRYLWNACFWCPLGQCYGTQWDAYYTRPQFQN